MAFFLCILYFLLCSSRAFQPIIWFLPLLSMLILQRSCIFGLYSAFLIGAGYDFLHAVPMGLFAMTFLLSTIALYRYREYFFADQPLSLALFSSLYTLVFTLIFPLVQFMLSGMKAPQSKDFLAHLISQPCIHGAYSYFCVFFPMAFCQEQWKRCFRFFLQYKWR